VGREQEPGSQHGGVQAALPVAVGPSQARAKSEAVGRRWQHARPPFLCPLSPRSAIRPLAPRGRVPPGSRAGWCPGWKSGSGCGVHTAKVFPKKTALKNNRRVPGHSGLKGLHVGPYRTHKTQEAHTSGPQPPPCRGPNAPLGARAYEAMRVSVGVRGGRGRGRGRGSTANGKPQSSFGPQPPPLSKPGHRSNRSS
jgi:hypothetical protein